MRIAFYTPFKPLGHHHPSGDLVIATGLYDYFVSRGHDIQQAGPLRARWIYWKPWTWIRLLKIYRQSCETGVPGTGKSMGDLPHLLQGPGPAGTHGVQGCQYSLCYFSGYFFHQEKTASKDLARVCSEPGSLEIGTACIYQQAG